MILHWREVNKSHISLLAIEGCWVFCSEFTSVFGILVNGICNKKRCGDWLCIQPSKRIYSISQRQKLTTISPQNYTTLYVCILASILLNPLFHSKEFQEFELRVWWSLLIKLHRPSCILISQFLWKKLSF